MGLVWRVLRAAVFIPVGIYLLVLGLQAWTTTLDLLAHATPATAHVTGSRRHIDDKGNVSYCPLLSFRPPGSHTVTVEGANVCQSSPFTRGAALAIHYRTNRPATIMVDGFAGTWFNPVVFSGLGLVLIAVPLLTIRAQLRRKSRLSTATASLAIGSVRAASAPATRQATSPRTSSAGQPAGAGKPREQPHAALQNPTNDLRKVGSREGAARAAQAALPPLPRVRGLYLTVLLSMVVAFYLLLVACFGLTIYALVRLVLWTPDFLAHQQSLGAFKLLLLLYGAVVVFGYAIVKGLLTRIGADPVGLRLERTRHPMAFALVDEVAARVQADPIHEIILTPGTDLAVWEETALYLPPGAGKRKIVLGMGALSYLTLDDFRCILAHEYAHFSHGDTFYGRFIYQVVNSARALLEELHHHGGKVQYLNPLYWILRLFAALFTHLAAAFSRLREHYADRRAVESYGRELFARALIAMHLEGSFFGQVSLGHLIDGATEGQGIANVYQAVAGTRRALGDEQAANVTEVLDEMLAATTGRLDTHPSLCQRLDAQGVPAEARHPYPLPRPVAASDPPLAGIALDMAAGSATETARDVSPADEPCAAEALFGVEALALQRALTDFYRLKYAVLIQLARQAQHNEAEEPTVQSFWTPAQ